MDYVTPYLDVGFLETFCHLKKTLLLSTIVRKMAKHWLVNVFLSLTLFIKTHFFLSRNDSKWGVVCK